MVRFETVVVAAVESALQMVEAAEEGRSPSPAVAAEREVAGQAVGAVDRTLEKGLRAALCEMECGWPQLSSRELERARTPLLPNRFRDGELPPRMLSLPDPSTPPFQNCSNPPPGYGVQFSAAWPF